jgi:hypothetical protein
MDDRSIAWMISGGSRTPEPRDRRLQREQRLDLALAAGPRTDPFAAVAAWFRGGIAARPPAATAALDCCPA